MSALFNGRSIAWYATLLAATSLACLAIYWPGLSGGFLLDDFPNLDRLSLLNADGPSGEFWRVVWMGQSGILRRPIAMLSFAVQHADWPNHPGAFKAFNLAVHVLCGALIYGLARLLARPTGLNRHYAHGLALVATAFWLFNPIHVSTTLYVVQRMTQLACLFSLLAVCLYLIGRRMAITSQTSAHGLVLMTLAVVMGGALAAFSKENGVLLPALLLVTEHTILAQAEKPPHWRAFQIIVLWLPLIALVALLAWKAPSLLQAYDYRTFSLGERLLTEPRVIVDYLGKILFPQPHAYGLFFDDFPVSKSLVDPWTTLPGLVLIALLCWSGWFFRSRFPWWSFAVLWFMVAHLLESTFLPLELYFEHRNYLASVGLALGVGWLGMFAWQQASARHVRLSVLCGGIVLLAGYGFVTSREVMLWASPVRQIAVWSHSHPHSLRGQLVWGWLLSSSGHIAQAEEHYRRADADYSEDPLFAVKGFALQCDGKTSWPSESILLDRLRDARYSRAVVSSIQDAVSRVEDHSCANLSAETWIKMVDLVLENPRYVYSRGVLWFLRARLLATENRIDLALESIDKSLALNPSLPNFTYPIAWLAGAGRPREATRYLARARIVEAAMGFDGILYKPVLDDWEKRLASADQRRDDRKLDEQ